MGRNRPSSFRLLTSMGDEHFSEFRPDAPGPARYVHVEVTGPDREEHTGLRELTVAR